MRRDRRAFRAGTVIRWGTVAWREDVVGHAQAHAPQLLCSSGPPAEIGVRWLPVPAGGDRARSALVPPLRTLVSRCGRAAGRARSAGRPRQHFPLGAALHAAAGGGGTPMPASRRGPLVG